MLRFKKINKIVLAWCWFSVRECVMPNWTNNFILNLARRGGNRSEEDLTLGVFFLSKNEWLASLEDLATSAFALHTLKLESDLLSLLCLLTEDWLGLATESLLLGIISPLSLHSLGVFAFLILGNFVWWMLLAFLAVSILLLGCVNLEQGSGVSQ